MNKHFLHLLLILKSNLPAFQLETQTHELHLTKHVKCILHYCSQGKANTLFSRVYNDRMHSRFPHQQYKIHE